MSSYRCEAERVDLDTEGRNVLLLKLASQMALDKGCLSCLVSTYDAAKPSMRCRSAYLTGTAVADKHKLEGRSTRLSFSHGSVCVVSECRVRVVV